MACLLHILGEVFRLGRRPSELLSGEELAPPLRDFEANRVLRASVEDTTNRCALRRALADELGPSVVFAWNDQRVMEAVFTRLSLGMLVLQRVSRPTSPLLKYIGEDTALARPSAPLSAQTAGKPRDQEEEEGDEDEDEDLDLEFEAEHEEDFDLELEVENENDDDFDLELEADAASDATISENAEADLDLELDIEVDEDLDLELDAGGAMSALLRQISADTTSSVDSSPEDDTDFDFDTETDEDDDIELETEIDEDDDIELEGRERDAA